MIEDDPQYLFFLENQPENYVTFEIEPVDTDTDDNWNVGINFLTERTSEDGLVLTSLVRECPFTITADQVRSWLLHVSAANDKHQQPLPHNYPAVRHHIQAPYLLLTP